MCIFRFLLVFATTISPFVLAISEHPLVLIIVFGGFRNDYFERGLTPNLNRLRNEATQAGHMKNVFPTKTLPNLQSIATGMYPETHGVVNNFVVDPVTRENISFHDLVHYNDKDVIPLWILNEKAGEGRHSGVMMWPSGEDTFDNELPTFRMPYDPHLPLEKRVDYIYSWYDHDETPANLVMVYIETPDDNFLLYGPNSVQVDESIRKVDDFVGILQSKFMQHGLWEEIDLFLLSDHGGSPFTLQNVIDLNKIIDKSWHVGFTSRTSPVLFIIPNEGYENKIYSTLKNISMSGNFMPYLKNEIPARWHLKQNARVAPIIVVADMGYVFQDYVPAVYEIARKNNVTVTSESSFGINGYDFAFPISLPFFLCTGPHLKKNFTLHEIETVDLYPLWSNLLNITPPENNGTFERVKNMLLGTENKRNESITANITSNGSSSCNFMLHNSLYLLSVIFLWSLLIYGISNNI